MESYLNSCLNCGKKSNSNIIVFLCKKCSRYTILCSDCNEIKGAKNMNKPFCLYCKDEASEEKNDNFNRLGKFLKELDKSMIKCNFFFKKLNNSILKYIDMREISQENNLSSISDSLSQIKLSDSNYISPEKDEKTNNSGIFYFLKS